MRYDTNPRDSQIRIDIKRLVDDWQRAFLACEHQRERNFALAIMKLAGEGATIAEGRMK